MICKILFILYVITIFIACFPLSKINKGDVNLDGEINALDCIIINRMIMNPTEDFYGFIQYINADINNDMIIDKKDIKELSNKIIIDIKENKQYGKTITTYYK